MKITEQQKKNLGRLDEWLKKNADGKVKLATFLEYKTTTTIDQWFVRKRIPRREEEQVMAYIKGASL